VSTPNRPPKVPDGIGRIIDMLAADAKDGKLDPRDLRKLEADMTNRPQVWYSLSIDAVATRCDADGLSLQGTSEVAELLRQLQSKGASQRKGTTGKIQLSVMQEVGRLCHALYHCVEFVEAFSNSTGSASPGPRSPSQIGKLPE
jgi:hypothetical protein